VNFASESCGEKRSESEIGLTIRLGSLRYPEDRFYEQLSQPVCLVQEQPEQ